MRLLDALVWQHLLREPCKRDHSRCPEASRQCAACPHRRLRAGRRLTRDSATIHSPMRRLLQHLARSLDQLLEEHPAQAFALLFLWAILFPMLLGVYLGLLVGAR